MFGCLSSQPTPPRHQSLCQADNNRMVWKLVLRKPNWWRFGFSKHPANINRLAARSREYIRFTWWAKNWEHQVYLVIEAVTKYKWHWKRRKKSRHQAPFEYVRAALATRFGKMADLRAGKNRNPAYRLPKFCNWSDILEKQKNRLDCLQLSHFHLSSQLGNIQDKALQVIHESARLYVELHKLGQRSAVLM